MKALITGASSGIGLSMAKYLSTLGYDLILVGRDKKVLESLQDSLETKVKLIVMDLSVESNVKSLYVISKGDNIDLLINCAGFGLLGEFVDTDINKELEMIDTNIRALHILTKTFLKDMKKRNSGRILNVASFAAFAPGPKMATYYATKAYVLRLSEAINYELTRDKSNVVVSVLCPPPVNTNFNKTAKVKFKEKGLNSDEVAKYAIDELLKGNSLIIPGAKWRIRRFFMRFVSTKFMMKTVYKFQNKSEK